MESDETFFEFFIVLFVTRHRSTSFRFCVYLKTVYHLTSLSTLLVYVQLPFFPNKWTNGNEQVLLNGDVAPKKKGDPILTMDSEICCIRGGIVRIQTSGQEIDQDWYPEKGPLESNPNAWSDGLLDTIGKASYAIPAVGMIKVGVNVLKTEEILAGFKEVSPYSVVAKRQLNEFYRQLNKYGQADYKTLQNGRIRFYGNVTKSKTPGPTMGRRVVREWDPVTNRTRTWHESITHTGKVNQVRIGPGEAKVHYRFENGKYSGKW